GKTTTLLQSAHNYRERGMRVAILTPRLDDRAGAGVVAARIGLRADGMAFDRDTDLQRWVEQDLAANGPMGCVLVDEAQSLTRAQVWQLSEVVD
ncbi:thymidine kinase, partial [Salmonella enterica]|nr:thymidine kinase [Salmonella enterica]